MSSIEIDSISGLSSSEALKNLKKRAIMNFPLQKSVIS